MKCNNCGHENKDNASYCVKCGSSLMSKPSKAGNNNNIIVVSLLAIICILLVVVGLFVTGAFDGFGDDSSTSSDTNNNSSTVSSSSVSSSQSTQATGEWQLIASYSGSGSGYESYNLPPGQYKIKISAFPIKNYATNHLYVTESNGASAAVDWGSHSSVETRSDSISFTSSSSDTINIDYYETVNWNVEVYQYK